MVADSECNKACTGNANEKCGSGWRNSVYTSLSKSAVRFPLLSLTFLTPSPSFCLLSLPPLLLIRTKLCRLDTWGALWILPTVTYLSPILLGLPPSTSVVLRAIAKALRIHFHYSFLFVFLFVFIFIQSIFNKTRYAAVQYSFQCWCGQR